MKTQLCWIIFGILSGTALAATILAQTNSMPDSGREYLITAWTTREGLPQNTVLSIKQTRDGYLWFTTLDGLVRYDGVRFTIFNKNNSPGLTSNRTTCLFEDAGGALWIGTEDGGVMRYAQGKFTAFTARDGLPHNLVHEIQAESAGGVRITTRDGFAFYRDGRLLPEVERADVFKFRRYLSPSGAVWTLDQAGLRQVKDGVATDYGRLVEISDMRVANFYEDRQGHLWFAAATAALFKIKDGTVKRYGPHHGMQPDARAGVIYEDRHGIIWAGGRRTGLLRLQDERFTAYGNKNGQDGLSDNEVRDIFEDREGNLWVGTNTGGLNRLSRKFMTTYSTAEGLHNGNVYPILQDRAGAVWLGARVSLTRFADGRFTNYTKKDGLSDNFHGQALCEDLGGRLWVGTYGGLNWIEDGKYHEGKFFSEQNVFAIHEDRTGNLWVGTEYRLFKCRDGVCKEYRPSAGTPVRDVKMIHEDRRGDLWIGSYGGLARLSGEEFTTWTEREGLPSNRVRYIHEDADGVFWIGTYDGGLSRFKDGRFTNYTVENGLFNNGVFQILEDARGIFWIGCNKGIYRVSKQQLNDYAEGKIFSIICTAYDQQDGMRNVECNGGRQPAGVRARDGKLWFPTLDGAVVVDPEAAPFNSVPPPVQIESVVLDRHTVDFQNEVRISPDQKYLEISYAGLSFVKSEQTRFRYRLEGQDNNWQEAGTRRVAYYSYLPPGDYTFTVTAANSDGIWNPAGASVRIVVAPPFWRTWWFLSLVSLSAAGLVFLVFRLRVAQLRRAHAAQEKFSRQLLDSQEQERQRIAAELHDSLGQSLLIIKNRSFLALDSFDDPDSAREQVEEISAASAHAIEEVREIAYNLRPYKMDRFGLTKTIQAMCQQAERTSGIRFVTELKNIDGVFPKEAELNLYRIVQESVNNILKHSRAIEARLTIERDVREVQLNIKDNGQGFPLAPTTPGEPRPGGFGLVGLAERVRLLGGDYTLDSAPGRGTTINIKLLIPEKTA
ncbi:MAG TPA: two-component regulator propeller domain-containing protein [Blastocatellia bacterium]